MPARGDSIEVDLFQPRGSADVATRDIEQVADEEAPQGLVLVEGPDHVVETEPGRQLLHQWSRFEQRRGPIAVQPGADRPAELVEVDDVVLVGLDVDVVPSAQGAHGSASSAGSTPWPTNASSPGGDAATTSRPGSPRNSHPASSSRTTRVWAPPSSMPSHSDSTPVATSSIGTASASADTEPDGGLPSRASTWETAQSHTERTPSGRRKLSSLGIPRYHGPGSPVTSGSRSQSPSGTSIRRYTRSSASMPCPCSVGVLRS